MRLLLNHLAIALLLAANSGHASAEEIRVAVASNFHSTAKEIAYRFQRETNHSVLLSAGSTGKHFAQIINGAPFDLLLAADEIRPEKLQARGLVTPGNRLTYAYGRLVLWQPNGLSNRQLKANLLTPYRKLAIANPRLAPYGRAALEILESLQIRDEIAAKLVQGENIAQAYQFVASGNAELGLVALSQMGLSKDKNYLLIPHSLHQPINQQMVLISEKDAAKAFFEFMQLPETLQLIRQSGYDTRDE